MNKPIIRNLTLEELTNWLQNKKQQAYRAKQVYQWLWSKNVSQLSEIKNIPKTLLKDIEESVIWDNVFVTNIQTSSDKTIKVAFELFDKSIIEGVIIPSDNRLTACISTQVGCPIKCSFCATGQMGFTRNLNVGEIIDQIVLLNKLSEQHFNRKLTNIVIMGMGEPFLNYDNTIKALHILLSPSAMNWSANRITLSTVGIPNAIKQFSDENLKIKLAISLHSAIQSKREQIIPISRKYKLDDIIVSLNHYIKKTKKEITFEYLMLRQFNDSLEDVKELVRLCSSLKSKVNLIKYNSVDGANFESSDEITIQWFYEYLKSRKINVKIRESRGWDIDAACGQLSIKIYNKK